MLFISLYVFQFHLIGCLMDISLMYVYETPNLALRSFCAYSMTRLLECVYRLAEQLQGLLPAQTVVDIDYQNSLQQPCCLLIEHSGVSLYCNFDLTVREILLRLAKLRAGKFLGHICQN